MILRRSVLVAAPWLFLKAAKATQAKRDDQPQTVSLLGRELYALPDDDGAIQIARAKLGADPKDASLALKLSKAQAAKRQYREAITTCTAALATAPNNADLLVERGHRELGLREFKAALADLNRAGTLDPKQLDAQYHLGLAYYFLREFGNAGEAFGRALDLARSNDSVIDCSNWRYVSLRRNGQTTDAARVLARITPEVQNAEPHLFFYLQLLHFYQGKLSEAEVLPAKPAGPTDIEAELSFNTINYGVGNWHLYNGDSAHAGVFFKNATSGFAWNSWGFIGSELELVNGPR
jgi:tetratricopeptide (TPR) repeat protein